jgi:hypothetical protein
LNGFEVSLYWLPSPPAGIESYNVYWSRTPGVTPATGQRVPGQFYVDRVGWASAAVLVQDHTGLSEGSYYYVVTAENDDGESPASPELHVVISGADLRLWEPLPFTPTSDEVRVIAPAAAAVTATLEGETIDLVLTPMAISIPWTNTGSCSTGWAGGFQSSITSGSKTLVVRALGTDGREARTEVPFTFAPGEHGPRRCF